MLSLEILIPHLVTPINDDALKVTLDSIGIGRELGGLSMKTLVITELVPGRTDPYQVWNEYAAASSADYIMFTNSDIVMLGTWLSEICVEIKNPDRPRAPEEVDPRIITGYLIEPGAIGVNSLNIHKDFGMCPRCFRRFDAEVFAAKSASGLPLRKREMGFVVPLVMSRRMFIKHGMFDTSVPFMSRPNDLLFFDKVLAADGQPVRIPWFSYHFQNLSRRSNRCGCYQQKSTNPAGF